MCGITGYYSFEQEDAGVHKLNAIDKALHSIKHRGPDGQGIFKNHKTALAHARLSILDISEAASQPFYSKDKRYVIVFNGEIFNFNNLKKELENQGVAFNSTSDTEVLLELYIKEKEACLSKLNGFFAFAVYDQETNDFFIARDRYGEKPLLYSLSEKGFAFGSEMKSLLPFQEELDLDLTSCSIYSHLNYIPAPHSVFQGINKLLPGNYIKISGNKVSKHSWYTINVENLNQDKVISYDQACEKLVELLDTSVKRRMISDVPLGAFLSGGIDSSVVVALASKYTEKLNTYSIGYVDEPLFDETKYAKLVAEKYETNHTVFYLTNEDLFAHLFEFLDTIDEPFADSSALAVYILCKETRKHATVALSGDGADELFGGYRKHQAEWRIRNGGAKASIVKLLQPLWNVLPESRNSKAGDLIRKLKKFSDGTNLTDKERYWKWCGYSSKEYSDNLWINTGEEKEFTDRKNACTSNIGETGDMNEMLLNDMNLVLPGDMLTKVDLMSMANGLEVRPPFLDVDLVDFAFSLPADYKVNGEGRKRIVQDAFRHLLPEELYNRPKQGFEVPLLNWFRTDLDDLIFNDLLSKKTIISQGLLNFSAIEELKTELHSNSPGDSTAKIWALIVFQWWWKKWMK